MKVTDTPGLPEMGLGASFDMIETLVHKPRRGIQTIVDLATTANSRLDAIRPKSFWSA